MLKSGSILVVDDDEYINLTAQIFLEQYFSYVKTTVNPQQFPRLLSKHTFDVILLDMNFQKGETDGKAGLYWLELIKEIDPNISVIFITAYSDIEIAVESIKSGAIDFIAKPWQNDKLLSTIHTAWQLSKSRRMVRQLASQRKILGAEIDAGFQEMIGESPQMKEVYKTIEKIAQTDVNVLILGENGTGKELVARAIYRNSDRKKEVFIPVDMGALSSEIFESELFGHKKGAFTDAKEDRIGRFEAANGGTIFLDEIGNLTLSLQAKLLRTLQSRQIVKLGSNKVIDINVRLICATNQSIHKMIKERTFRQDLLYRINTVEIHLPPLRDRQGDITLLIQYFSSYYCQKYGKKPLAFPIQVIEKMQEYSWPGNIRELQHAIERIVILNDGMPVKTKDLHFLKTDDYSFPAQKSYNLSDLEKWAIKQALVKHAGNVSKAAEEVGLTRGAFYRRMEKYGL